MRYYNSILGAIVGDIVGSTREWHNVKTEDFELLPAGSHFTDDTVMTLAVAEWLMTDPDHTEAGLVDCLQRLGRRYPHAGYGRNFEKWLFSEDPHPYGSYGNGSAMRVSPVGWYAHSLEEALDLARITAQVTHNHPEGIKGAQALAACIYLRRTDPNFLQTMKVFVTEHFGYDLDIALRDLRPSYAFDVSCQGSVPIAIMAYLQAPQSVEAALRLAISMGGDSDTIGCMTAAIATAGTSYDEASSRLSPELERACLQLLTPDLREINDRFIQWLQQELSPTVDSIADRIRGSLMAGAAGDALGYEVEFTSRQGILHRYGAKGITTFALDAQGKALVSDDTQMTLFTANGMLTGITRGSRNGINVPLEEDVPMAYVDWYHTQRNLPAVGRPCTWLRDLPEMAYQRAPGNTCLYACHALLHHQEVENNSKGCGGIMRVAPLGLYLAACQVRQGKCPYDRRERFEAGAQIAKVTHLHPLGFLPAGMMTELLYQLMLLSPAEACRQISSLAETTLTALYEAFEGEYMNEKRYLAELTEKAIQLAHSEVADDEAIAQLGEGWVGEEAWAIALFCVIRHIDNCQDALVASVNHDGDSDSTGAITGNLMGAIYGYEALAQARLCCPEGRTLEDTLELFPIICALADDLATGSIIDEHSPIDTPEKQQWYERYCEMRPAGIM